MGRLLTIPISHYCEHRIASRRAGGRGTMPLLVADDGVYAGAFGLRLFRSERRAAVAARSRVP